MLVTKCLVYVAPYQFGIKAVKIPLPGQERGISKEVYETGWVLQIPMMSQLHLLPKGIQVLDLTNSNSERSDLRMASQKAAHIQTSDGFFVTVDVSILYRIEDPYKVITIIGPGRLYIDNGIIPRAEPILKQSLGTLTTEEFYNSHLRTDRVQASKDLLNKELEPKGIKIEDVLIRYFQYSPEIQRNIEEKKLKDQLVFKNQSEALAAKSEANLKKVIQEGEANVSIKLQEGQAYIMTKRAEQDLYTRKRHAEADLLVQLANAYGTELKNVAYQSLGSEYMVGLKMAGALDGLSFIMLPSSGSQGFNPLDLNSMIKLFGISKAKANKLMSDENNEK